LSVGFQSLKNVSVSSVQKRSLPDSVILVSGDEAEAESTKKVQRQRHGYDHRNRLNLARIEERGMIMSILESSSTDSPALSD